MAQVSNFVICRTCGKYVETSQPVKAGYCSDFCAQKYECCITCGKFTVKEDMYKEQFCSQECSIQYELKESTISKTITRQMKVRDTLAF